jgi:single-strand DNA-binding protein
MASFNRVVLMGNLTRDPDFKQLSSGQAVCKLSLASNRQFKNKQSGAMVQEVCYIDIDVWGAQAESCRQYLQKGRGVLVEGRLKLDSWEDAEGKTRSKHSIVADRVVFLASQQSSDVEAADHEESNDRSGARLDLSPEIDEELNNQINAVKARQAKKATAKTETNSAAQAFVDEPPFQDDLPF